MSVPFNTKVRVWGVFTQDGRLRSDIDCTVNVFTVKDGITSEAVTGAQPVVSGDKLFYDYVTVDDVEDVHATFKTTSLEVDFLEVPSLGLSLEKIVDDITSWMTPYGHIMIGQGRGGITYDDTVLKSGRAVSGCVVKAYAIVDDLIDWEHVVGMHVTNGNGEFTLYLNEGPHILSFEKNGSQIGAKEIAVI